MDALITENLIDLLLISITFSVFLMSLIQKFKNLKIINRKWHIWLLNLIFSFAMGIPFTMYFYNLDIQSAIWVSIFSFIGAPTIYETLKKQNLITYKPKSLNESKTISTTNEIPRT